MPTKVMIYMVDSILAPMAFDTDRDACLHCRLHRQEKARGAVANDLEFVTERLMQTFKRIAGKHVSSRVEVHFAQQFLLGQSLERIAREHPECRGLEAVLGRGERDYSQEPYDQGADGVMLLGAGTPVTSLSSAVVSEIESALAEAIKHEWDPDLLQWRLPGGPSVLAWFLALMPSDGVRAVSLRTGARTIVLSLICGAGLCVLS